jgi:ketosteroid isomerase-like protein
VREARRGSFASSRQCATYPLQHRVLVATPSGPEAPGALHQRMARLFNEGSLDGLVALYTDDATLAPEPGKSASGRAALREALSGVVALRPRGATFTTVGVVRAGGVALTRSHCQWSARPPRAN